MTLNTRKQFIEVVSEHSGYIPVVANQFVERCIWQGSTLAQFMEELSLEPLEREGLLEAMLDFEAAAPLIQNIQGVSLKTWLSQALTAREQHVILSVQAPVGCGLQPQNALLTVMAFPNEEVRWTLDQNGWATGYTISLKG